MNKTQCKRAVALIKKDCHLRLENINEKGQTCAIGCLALASGVSKRCLMARRTEGVYEYPRIVQIIKRKFGLGYDEQMAIQKLNDCEKTPVGRRRAIVKYLKALLKQKAG